MSGTKQAVAGAAVALMQKPALRRGAWEPLGPPAQCMGFDFYDSVANMKPASSELLLPIIERGVCNAMAFWFELHLDEESSLSTSPYVSKVASCVCCFGCSHSSRLACALRWPSGLSRTW